MFEAAKGHHYGLDAKLAFQSVFAVPAERMGQDHRIGYARVGYDADIVIWDKNPLEIGAHPLKVFVDGYSTFEHDDYEMTIKQAYTISKKNHTTIEIKLPDISVNRTMTFANISGLVHSASATQERNSMIVVQNGVITCLGAKCQPIGHVVDMHQSFVIPGIIAAGVHLGLEEISSESVTSAGRAEPDDVKPVYSSYGLRVGRKHSRMLDSAFKAGITTAISSLRFTGSIGAYSTAFRVGAVKLNNETIIADYSLQEFRLGDDAKRLGIDSSISGQFSRISNVKSSQSVVVRTNGANLIYQLTRHGGPITILGGSEAHMVPEAFRSDDSVILSPARCVPSSWTSQDCLLTSQTPTAVDILQKAGVNVGLSVSEDNLVRGLIWEAGWKVADSIDYKNLSNFEIAKRTAALVTWNIAKAYKLKSHHLNTTGEIAVGQRPNFVAYDGIPGTLDAKVILVVDGDLMETDTTQY